MKIGIIGGSGLENLSIFGATEEINISSFLVDNYLKTNDIKM